MALAGDPEMTEYFEEAASELPQLRDRQIALQFLEAHLEFSPVSVIERKKERPLLLIAAELDVVCPPEGYKGLYDRAPEPKKWIVFENMRHFEFYSGESAMRSAAEAVNFFKEYLSN
jgi:alpha-beta hydrolase superfamily lysophospholipase